VGPQHPGKEMPVVLVAAALTQLVAAAAGPGLLVATEQLRMLAARAATVLHLPLLDRL
jgi:hypothetical protein